MVLVSNGSPVFVKLIDPHDLSQRVLPFMFGREKIVHHAKHL